MCYSGAATLFFGDGTRVTVIEQNVSLPHVKILEPVPYKSNEFVTLVCLATDFYPDHIELTWEINKKKTTDNAKSDYRAVQSKSKTYSISSRLRVSRNVWCNADNVFTCVAKFYNETDKAIYITDHVSGKGKLKKDGKSTKFAYILLLCKSCLYGLIILFLIWKLKHSSRKQS
ncbi:T cell receptor beta chain MC.7.G5-like [Erpetoichthys calabaricus]|uniref:T cell receptor beta chain MC.7.G5-like n=1 Tax=Erpetoichthys calabaricus TaxID=27687 RepID=UPI0022349C5F|nr:T cell receptor beta chain MC.7.G5-like [Erpetoichthys calabaricus]